MEEVSDIMKKEIEDGRREWLEMQYAVPVLRRILAHLKVHQLDELKDSPEKADALVLPIILIENEIEKLEGK